MAYLKELGCPKCGETMKTRTQTKEHANAFLKKVYKHTWHQYYCEKCDDNETGWTTTESDQLSITYIKKNGK